jgi:hypothetical protein
VVIIPVVAFIFRILLFPYVTDKFPSIIYIFPDASTAMEDGEMGTVIADNPSPTPPPATVVIVCDWLDIPIIRPRVVSKNIFIVVSLRLLSLIHFGCGFRAMVF